MAKPNYSFAKRQRDLAKEQKKEEKLQRKNAALAEEQAQTDAPETEAVTSDSDSDETPAA